MDRVFRPTEKDLKKSRKGGEDCAAETVICNVKVLLERVLSMIEFTRRKARKDLKHRAELYVMLEAQLETVERYVLNLMDNIEKIVVLARSARETTGQIDPTVEESKESTVEFEAQKAQANSGIGGKLMKMLLSICKSGDRLTEEPKGSFELGSISFLFDQMRDDMLQLQLLPTEAQFLSISMLTDKTLEHKVASRELCCEYIDWLSIWVPELLNRLQRIKKDAVGKKVFVGADAEERRFVSYISSWERVRKRSKSVSFDDLTPLSSMLFTHYIPGHHPLFADVTRTMQILSIKITDLEGGFKWPLEIYGVVAARDAVDYRRNHLFLRSRDNCQSLKKEDSFLHLTGPSRAIMSADKVHIEIQLKVKGTIKSQDRSLITEAFACDGDDATTHSIHGCFCRIELCCENLRDSIQATIISIRVMEGSLNYANGLQVACFSLPEEDDTSKAQRTTSRVFLLDGEDRAVPIVEEGYLVLSRQIVSVQLNGRLEVVTKAGGMRGSVVFKPELSNISQKRCTFGDCTLEITVAWSLLVDDEEDMVMMSYTKPIIAPSSFPFMKLVD